MRMAGRFSIWWKAIKTLVLNWTPTSLLASPAPFNKISSHPVDMPTAIRIVNDTILPAPHDSYETGLTPRESQTRLAFFVLGFGAPLFAALLALFTTSRWWKRANIWFYPRLCALWFISVAAVAAIIFFLPGMATRSTFVTAIIHGMVEVGMITHLLGATSEQSLIAAMVFALVDFAVLFSVPDPGYVFIVAAILGGANDFLLPLLLFYGRQPLLAYGAIAHTIAAVTVFTSMVHDLGVIAFTLISFFALWGYVGFTIAGLRASRTSTDEYPRKLMKVPVPPTVLATFLIISYSASTATALLLAYVAPKIY